MTMKFRQVDVDAFRIYAMAFDGPQGGYAAGVEVRRINHPSEVVYRNERLSAGRAFERSDDALERAVEAGQRAVRSLLEASG
jgi:hypothetical protein